MERLNGWLYKGHVTWETTIIKGLTTWMGCLENDENNDAPIEVSISTATL